MSYLATGLATTDPSFRLRVQAVMFKIAQDVLNEDETADAHLMRAGLARDIVFDPGSKADQFVWLCAANPTIAASVAASDTGPSVAASDSDLEYVVASYWSTVAGWIAASNTL